jgi:hypothetical protein
MMATPNHLEGLVVRDDTEFDEQPLVAPVRCPCGGEVFEILYPGQTHDCNGETVPCVAKVGGNFFLVLKVQCKTCEQEHVLLDKDKHGYNGYVCHDPDQSSLPRPGLTSWQCLGCCGTGHRVVVTICTAGRAHFEGETDGEFDPETWPEAFSWFRLGARCVVCDRDTPGLIDYETM